jgi:hypothetical protein
MQYILLYTTLHVNLCLFFSVSRSKESHIYSNTLIVQASLIDMLNGVEMTAVEMNRNAMTVQLMQSVIEKKVSTSRLTSNGVIYPSISHTKMRNTLSHGDISSRLLSSFRRL